MRCPKCKLVASEKRDICPGCFFDLRPEKSRLGLTVGAPTAPYETLVETLKKSLSEERERKPAPPLAKKKKKSNLAPKKPPTLLERITSLFFKPEKKTTFPEKRLPKVKVEESITELISAEPVITHSKELETETKPVEQVPPSNQIELAVSDENELVFPEPLFKQEKKEPDTSAPSQSSTLSIDDLAFESLFEEGQLEPLAPPPEIPVEIQRAEELLRQLSQTLDDDIEHTKELTDAIRELSFESEPELRAASASPIVMPEVLEFTDDDALLEEQLNEILGDDILEVAAVKPATPKPAPMAASAATLQVEDDLEISFEFELEENTVEPVSEIEPLPKIEEPTISDSPADLLSSLEDALISLEEDLEERSVSEKEEVASSQIEEELETELERVSSIIPPATISHPPPRFSESLRKRPDELCNVLLQHLAEMYHCSVEELFEHLGEENADENLENLENELDNELNLLLGEGFSIHSEEIEIPEEIFIDEPLPKPISQEAPVKDLSVKESSIALAKEPINERVRDIREVLPPVQEKTDLWSKAEAEIHQYENDDVEIDLSEMVDQKVNEKTLLLFDTAYQAMIDKTVDQAFKTKVEISVDKELETKKLEKIFETYGDAAAEEFALREKQAFNSSPKIIFNKAWEAPPTASLWRRPLAFMADVMIAGIVAAGYLWFVDFSEVARNYILAEGLPGLFILGLPKLGLFGAIWFGFFFLTTSILIWGRGQSFGQKFFGCRTILVDDEKVSLTSAVLRTSALVTDGMMGFPGFLLTFDKSRRSLADHLSGTYIAAS